MRRNEVSNIDWTAASALRSDGYCVEMAIPFKQLAAVPKPGESWRLNIVTASKTPDGKMVACSWSSPEVPYELPHELPRQLGTLFGALRFE